MEKRHFAITDIEIRAEADADAPSNKLIGYAAVFDRASHDLGGFREFIAPGAFKRSLEEVEAGDQNDNIFAFWAHRDDQPLGSVQGGKLKLTEDEKGLRFELDTSRFNPMQMDAAKDGELRMSFGFSVRKQEWTTADDGVDERVLHDMKLFEVSPVVNRAYPDTSAALRQYRNWRDAREADQETIAVIEEVFGLGEAAEAEKRARDEAWEAKRIELLKRIADTKVFQTSNRLVGPSSLLREINSSEKPIQASENYSHEFTS